MDFLVSHFDDQISQHRANKPFIKCIMTGWYTLDKYYNKIDETGAYAAATLLHPNKRKSYLQAAWKTKWIKPGLRRAEELWSKKYEKLDPVTYSPTPLLDAEASSDREEILLTAYERWRQDRFAKMHPRNTPSEFERFINAPADSIHFTEDYTVLAWWLEPSQRRTYPRLYHIAIDILSAPAMSAQTERVFSRPRRQISFDRTTMTAEAIA